MCVETVCNLLQLALNEKLEVIKALDMEVIELIQDDGLDADIERADEFKETTFTALLSVDHLLKRLNPTPVATTASVREPSTHASSHTYISYQSKASQVTVTFILS